MNLERSTTGPQELVKEGVSRGYPIYIINALRRPRSDEIKLLLGPHLETTSVGIGECRKTKLKNGTLGYPHERVHIKSDAPLGMALPRSAIDNPYDIRGGIGGPYNWTEQFKSVRGAFHFSVQPKNTRYTIGVMVFANEPTLVISRAALRNKIEPNLAFAEADPFFGEVLLLTHGFQELVDSVLQRCKPSSYLYIER